MNKIPLVILVLFLITIGIFGVLSTDFGDHWDERMIFKSVINSEETGLLLPRRYFKPSIPYDITMIATAVKSTDDLLNFKVSVRKVFFLLSILSCIPIYFFTTSLLENSWSGLLSALMLITSFEFTYHARWIAPDALLVLFVSCSILSQYKIITDKKPLWIVVSSILLGLCFSTKYPGGIVVVPLIISILLSKKYNWILLSLTIAGLTFILTTPGAVLEPKLTFKQIVWIANAYNNGWHIGYITKSWIDYFIKTIVYLFAIAPSKNIILSCMLFPLFIVGFMSIFKKKTIALWFLSAPILYSLVMSTYTTMIVRNFLLLFPYIFILISIGIFSLYHALNNKIIKKSIIVFATFLILYNINIVKESSMSVIHKNTTQKEIELKKYITSHDSKFYLSPECSKMIDKKYQNITTDIDSADSFIFRTSEADRRLYMANLPKRYNVVWSLTNEINFDYYPTWYGDRIMEVSMNDSELHNLIYKIKDN